MARERQLEILRTIVSHYVDTREPVSSKTVAADGGMDVSSATIRNEMNVLESEGLIYQPHTSAGRVPTELGYRTFVDGLIDLQPLPEPQRRAIEQFLNEAVDFEDVIARTVRLLAQLTRSAAVAQFPVRAAARLRRLEVVDLASRWLIVVAITNDGQVYERRLDAGEAPGEDALTELRDRLNLQLEDMSATSIRLIAEDVVNEFKPAHRRLARLVVDTLLELLSQQTQSRLIVAGLSNLARTGEDFADVSGVLDALEQQVALLRLLSEVHTDQLQVSIGTENRDEDLEQTSIVSGAYHTADNGSAHVGIVGPTRMNYARSLIAVEAVSRYLSRLVLGENH